jgi:hypothetical protein
LRLTYTERRFAGMFTIGRFEIWGLAGFVVAGEGSPLSGSDDRG